jgi:transposase
MWVPPEVKDPVVLHHPTRKSVGYFAAVRLRDGCFVFARETYRFDGQSFFDFLEQLHAQSQARKRRVEVISDNAKYHHAKLHAEWREQHRDRFALNYLPPYSPDLNPIERVWKLVRKLRLHDQYFAKLDEVIATVEAQFTEWARGSEALRKLCAL